jgi:hypothetical protein
MIATYRTLYEKRTKHLEVDEDFEKSILTATQGLSPIQ